MRVHVISLGCSKNLVDSERICASLGMAGMELSSRIEASDCIVINTCGFIRAALEESEQEIRRVLGHARKQGKKVYVYGCAVTRAQDHLRRAFPEVSGWFAVNEQAKLLRNIHADTRLTNVRLLATHGYAYLKIAEGCSNNCAYCTIPSIRGPYRSRDAGHLIREANDLAACGIKELILIAQDTGRYGLDTHGKHMLVPLIRELSQIDGIKWLRIMYMHPKSLDKEFIDEMALNPRVCKYLDIPIQHISDRILMLMNRGVTRHAIEDNIRLLRKIENISIRTTVITGFPTETEDEFKELVDYVDKHFDWLGVFSFSPEPGTRACALPALPQEVIDRRYAHLLDVQQTLIKQRNQARSGDRYQTLIHGRNGHYIGHCEFACPEIDSLTIVNSGPLSIGDFVMTEITGTVGSDLQANVVEEDG